MKLKEKISYEDIGGDFFKIRVVNKERQNESAFPHYLHNHKNGVLGFLLQIPMRN